MKSQNSSSQGLAPWDTPYNRALNKVLGNDVGKKPATGHVVGDENSVRWDYYYHESKDLRKERKRTAHASIEEKIDRLVNRKTRLVVQDELATQFQAILPIMVEPLANWYNGGQKGPFPIPRFDASNSNNTTRPNEPIFATPSSDAHGGEHSPANTVPSITPLSSLPCPTATVCRHWISSKPSW
jgi:hypothetical protein